MLRLLFKFIISNFMLVLFSINMLILPQVLLFVRAYGNDRDVSDGRKIDSQDNKKMKILFLSERDETTVPKAKITIGEKLYKKDLDTGIETSILDNEISPKVYRWSPDGKQVVFAGEVDWETSLYLINEDGSGMRELFSYGDRRVTINEMIWGGQGILQCLFMHPPVM